MTALRTADAAIGPYARESLRLLLRKCAKAIRAAGKSSGPDEVHDVRTALRRLLACMELFEQFTNTEVAAGIRGKSKKLMKAAGAVRDLDIAIAILEKSGIQVGGPLRKLQRERKRKAGDFEDRVEKWNASKYCQEWAQTLFSGADPAATGRFDAASQARDEAAIRLPEIMNEFLARGDQILKGDKRTTYDPARLHGYRLRAKQIRYALEAFEECYKGKAPGMKDLRTLQDLLGSLNDMRQLRKRLFKGGVPGKPWETKLSAHLSRQYSSELRQLQQHWQTRFSGDRRESLRRQLALK